MREMRRSVIVSHGGKHGRRAKTYLKGSNLSVDAVDIVPSEMVGPEKGQAAAPTAMKDKKPAPVPESKSILPPQDMPSVKKPKSASQLHRWSHGRLQQLAAQEGIEAVGVEKDDLAEFLVTHLGLK